MDGHFVVKIAPELKDVLPDWGRSTRSSPLFSLDGALAPPLTGQLLSHLCFIGPLSPDEVPPGLEVFLSFGLYNIVIFASTKAARDRLRTFLGKLHSVAWELWVLRGSRVSKEEFSPALKRIAPTQKQALLEAIPADLISAVEEYQTLIAVSNSRSIPYLPGIPKDLEILDCALRDKLKNPDLHSIRKLQWFRNINAALSRFSSQTYAGISPILGSECHFWTNSLLGIGMATKALLKFRRHIDAAADRASFAKRIALYKKREAGSASLRGLSAFDEWWSTNQLPDLPISGSKHAAPQLPLVVCFSGRDGYKSTTFTLSAPLEVLKSANTCAWSLQTLTHEISHIFVESIIAALLEDDFESKAWAIKVLHIYKGTRPPLTIHDQLQEFFVFALARLQIEALNGSAGESFSLTDDNIPKLIATHYQEVSELLAHFFDFLHFYLQDSDGYITSIWLSWDVIPNIKGRVPEYITRSLCALHLANMTVRGGIEATLTQLSNSLQRLKRSLKHDQYIVGPAKPVSARTD